MHLADILFLPQPYFVFLLMLDWFFSIPLHLKIVYQNCVKCRHFSMNSDILSFSAHSSLLYGATYSHNSQFPNQRNVSDLGFRQSSLIFKTHTFIQDTLVEGRVKLESSYIREVFPVFYLISVINLSWMKEEGDYT